MKSLWIALGIVGTIPLLAQAATPSASRSVIKPAGFSKFNGGCASCAEPAPTCCTPMPAPTVGRCCPRPCILESIRRGLRSLDCLLPCGLAHSPYGGGGCGCAGSCSSCTSSCEVPSCSTSCCTKSRAHFFAFCKPKCLSCGPSCCAPAPTCCTAVPSCGGYGPPAMELGPPPQPDTEINPFQDAPMDPAAPPNRGVYYKPYWKKNTPTAANVSGYPTPANSAPARLDPYAVAPPVKIQARPIQPASSQQQPAAKVAVRAVRSAEDSSVRLAAANEVAPVALNVADDAPPAPPMLLPRSTPKRIDLGIPVNPLR